MEEFSKDWSWNVFPLCRAPFWTKVHDSSTIWLRNFVLTQLPEKKSAHLHFSQGLCTFAPARPLLLVQGPRAFWRPTGHRRLCDGAVWLFTFGVWGVPQSSTQTKISSRRNQGDSFDHRPSSPFPLNFRSFRLPKPKGRPRKKYSQGDSGLIFCHVSSFFSSLEITPPEVTLKYINIPNTPEI